MTSTRMHPATIFDILEQRANAKSRNVLHLSTPKEIIQ